MVGAGRTTALASRAALANDGMSSSMASSAGRQESKQSVIAAKERRERKGGVLLFFEKSVWKSVGLVVMFPLRGSVGCFSFGVSSFKMVFHGPGVLASLPDLGPR